ncbi:MAG: hypothetical protein M5U19_19720 [Microthrixaceae bacterium]|nr:hypothetical protein [Microthrixaceae bacterium]
MEELADALGEHRSWLDASGEGSRRRDRRARDELHAVLVAELHRRADAMVGGERWEAALADVLALRRDPWAAARILLDGTDALDGADVLDGTERRMEQTWRTRTEAGPWSSRGMPDTSCLLWLSRTMSSWGRCSR